MAPTRATSTVLTALAVCGMLTLTGCGGNGQAAPSASNSASATAAPAPDTRPTPASSTAPARNIPVPELPEAAKKNTKEGFEAFVRHYIALLDYAYQTGDTKPALAVGDAECGMCGTITKDASTVGDESWLVGGELSPSDLSADPTPDIHGIWLAYLKLRQQPFTDYKSSSPTPTPASTSKGGDSSLLLARARFVSGAWQMFDLGVPKGTRR
ncbi:DUF6318 family protein [Sinomonas halotolerans]|uniref:DUF6318 family protein n=1 Tax=Sinomonas halotolerans TaxID=1644133 RepID=A0ABU9X0P8_9MICC